MGMGAVDDLRLRQAASKEINRLARMHGVPYGYWESVSIVMRRSGIEKVEIADFLAHGFVAFIHTKRIPHFDVVSMSGEPCLIKQLTIALSLGSGMIEIVNLAIA
jgi:hypothetical protein